MGRASFEEAQPASSDAVSRPPAAAVFVSAAMAGTSADASEVLAVQRRAAAVVELRRGLVQTDPAEEIPPGDKMPLVRALKGLVTTFEDLTDDQTAVIVKLKRDVACAAADAAGTARRADAIKDALRKSVEKNVAASRRVDTQATAIACLEARVDAGKAALESVAGVADERRAQVCALKDALVARDIARLEAESAAKSQAARISQMSDKLSRAKASYAARVSSLNERVVALEAGVQRAQDGAAAAEGKVGERDARVARLEKALRESEDARAAAEDARAAAEDAATSRGEDLDRRDAELREATLRAEESAQLSVMHSERIAALESSIENMSVSREQEECSLHAAMSHRSAAEDALEESNRVCAALREEMGSLQRMCATYASAIAGAAQQLNAVNGGQGKALSPLIDVESATEIQEIDATCFSPENGFPEAGSEMAVSSLGTPDFANEENVLRESNVPRGCAQSAKKLSKFTFRVDVPDFKPTGLCDAVSEQKVDGAAWVGNTTPTATVEKLFPNASYQSLFWCPPGTLTQTLVSTVHREDPAQAQVVELASHRWADGAALWFDIATALIPGADCASNPPAEGSPDFWESVEAAFLSVRSDEGDEAPAPIIFVLRDAGLLAPYKNDASHCNAFEACAKIAKLVEVLFGIRESLSADRFSVSVVLEGWPSSILLGEHVAQSLALPRVSRRSGKTKRYRSRNVSVAV